MMAWIADLFKSPLPTDFFSGACDMHSHLLPGVDDGFPSNEKTLEALAFLKSKGVAKVKMTPHFMKDYPDNTRENIEKKFKGFCEETHGQPMPQLSLGGEYMLDSAFPQRVEEGLLPLNQEFEIVLCETSYMMMEPGAKEMLYDVMLKGYQPVIAHPERYNYANMSLYKRWKEKDYLFQLNLLSLAGAYGKPAMEKAHQMLKAGMYEYIGSDLHRLTNVAEMVSSIKLTTKEMELLELLLENNKRLG